MDGTDRLSFAADAALGKLAKWLRILGFDTIYVPDAPADRFLEFGKGRILLTRTRRIRNNNRSHKLVFIRSNNPYDQLKEVIRALGFTLSDTRPFSRCIPCNAVIEPADKDSVRFRVPDYIWETHDTFQACRRCGRIYWPGSHTHRCRDTINMLFDSSYRYR